MKRAPRVLIVSASIGTGHNHAAAALAKELHDQCPEARIEIADFLTYGNSSWGNFLKEAYFRMLHIFPDMYDFLYRWTSEGGHRVKNLLAYSSKKRMRNLCQQYAPDILIFTHPFPCAAACYLRRKGVLNIPVVAVVTDFTVHAFWLYQEVDLYCVGSESLGRQLQAKGFPPRRIMVSGIPIHRKFAKRESRRNFYRRPDMHTREPVVLIMGGGMGLGPLENLLLSLERFAAPLQLIVLAGNNKEIVPKLQALAEKSRHSIGIKGFTEDIDTLMELADILITKPGGLTASEALAKGLPMLLIPVIPGHEKENAQFLVQQGAAVQVRSLRAIPHYLNRLLVKKPEELTALSAAAVRLAKPQSACRVATRVLQMLEKNSAGKAAN